MKRILVPRRLLLLAPLVSAGCALGPTPQHSPVDTPSAWREAPPAAAPLTPAHEPQALPFAWWRIFDDPQLDAIEAQVVASNQDLEQGIARVDEARAIARLSAADRTPQFSLASEAVRQRTSANQSNHASADRTTSDHRSGFDLSYEVDFWGRNRHAANAARADALAAEHDFSVVRLTLTADAARHYLELRALDAETRVIEATIASRRDALALQITRHQAGLINEVDVARARAELAGVEAELHAVARARARVEHALAVLCGQPPGSFSVATYSSAFTPPIVPAGLPSELLQRRPDIAAAEQHLEAARSRIAASKADFFPRLSLTGSFGLASSELGNLAKGDSGTWSFGPRMHLPLFDGGRTRANLDAAEARYEQSAAVYRGTVLNAFREVEDALAELRTLELQRDAVGRALAAARDTAALAAERYQRGLSSYLDVIDAQRGVFETERTTAQLSGHQAVSTVRLAKALGGGWHRQSDLAMQ